MILLNPSYVVVYSVINMGEQFFSTLSYDISYACHYQGRTCDQDVRNFALLAPDIVLFLQF